MYVPKNRDIFPVMKLVRNEIKIRIFNSVNSLYRSVDDIRWLILLWRHCRGRKTDTLMSLISGWTKTAPDIS